MLSKLLNLYRKKVFRQPKGNGLLQFFKGIFYISLYLAALGLGLEAEEWIIGFEAWHQGEPLPWNGLLWAALFWLALVDVLCKLFLLRLDFLQLGSLRLLPVPPKELGRSMAIVSLFNFLTLLPILALLAFSWQYGFPSFWEAALFFGAGFSFFISLHFVEVRLKVLGLLRKSMVLFLMLALLGLVFLGMLEKGNWVYALASLLDNAYTTPIFLILFLACLPLSFRWLETFLSANIKAFHKENKPKGLASLWKRWALDHYAYRYLQKIGEVGNLMVLEWKLIFRHKRTRMVFYSSFLYPVVFSIFLYTQGTVGIFSSHVMRYIFLVFIAGTLALNYGQFLPAWDAKAFDFHLTGSFGLKNYLKAKLYNLYLFIGLFFVPGLLVLSLGLEWFPMYLGAFFFTLLILPPVLLIFGTSNKQLLNLDDSNVFNYQGVDLNQFIMAIPIMVLLALFVGLIRGVWGMDYLGLKMAATAIVLMPLHLLLLPMLEKQYKRSKYKLGDAFRGSDD